MHGEEGFYVVVGSSEQQERGKAWLFRRTHDLKIRARREIRSTRKFKSYRPYQVKGGLTIMTERVLKRLRFTQPSGTKIELIQSTDASLKPSELRYFAERFVNGESQQGLYWYWKLPTDRAMLEWEYFERRLQLQSRE